MCACVRVCVYAGVFRRWVGGCLSDVAHNPRTTASSYINLKTANRFEVKTIWNAIATVPGAVEPDRWVSGRAQSLNTCWVFVFIFVLCRHVISGHLQVVLGNHRDAWVSGGVDPSSGSASLLEVRANRTCVIMIAPTHGCFFLLGSVVANVLLCRY